MSTPLQHWHKLEKSAHWLLPELREQLAKDLDLDSGQVPKESLLDWLSDWLEQRIAQPGLLQQLYKVDLSENHTYSNVAQLAQAVLNREAQKVLFRAQMRGDL